MEQDIAAFAERLRTGGVRAALHLLNGRTAHRFTGVYRYDGEWLRNVALVDRWDSRVTKGEDAVMDQTFCALVPGQGGRLDVQDGARDDRFPWMHSNPVVSYCGTLILDPAGEPFGTVCHFDMNPCDAAKGEMPLLVAAAKLLYRAIEGDRPLVGP